MIFKVNFVFYKFKIKCIYYLVLFIRVLIMLFKLFGVLVNKLFFYKISLVFYVWIEIFILYWYKRRVFKNLRWF